MSSNAKTKTIMGVELNILYMIIWAVLLGLTVIEVAIPEMSGAKDIMGLSFARTTSIFLLVMLAAAKTFCVAWFYMHLVDERPMIVLIACTPFLFSIFLTIGLFPWGG